MPNKTSKTGSESRVKKHKNHKRNHLPEILLVLSAMILGTLVVFLVYRVKHPENGDEKATISGSYPLPSELTEDEKSTYFSSMEIPDLIFSKMDGVTFPDDNPVAREELRYLKVLYWGTDGAAHQGELIVNEAIAADVQDIFYDLYKAYYPIESIKLANAYNGNDEVSMANNNTCAFNGRKATDSDEWSNHAYGYAIDLNPYYNPYVNGETIYPVEASQYADRTQTFNMKIDHEDYAYRVFTNHGFSWGGDWENVKDYQHFEKVPTE